MPTATLTSLAMLKVNIDQGRDYLHYLRPFVLQVLVDHMPDSITDRTVKDLILEQFGLEIPRRTVQIVLKRIARDGYIGKEQGSYQITGRLPDPRIASKQSQAARHINSVVTGLHEFSHRSPKPFATQERAEAAICSFLSEFDISCLKSYLRGTAIPTIDHQHHTDVVLVSQYVMHLVDTDPERFESFMIMVQGHMLANALLCPDLKHVSSTYRDVTFYLDTPLLIQCLGLDGPVKQDAAMELLRLLKYLKATICTFAHSRDELRRVLRGAAANVDSPNGRGAIVMEARRRRTTRSDLVLIAEQIDDRLAAIDIQVQRTPRYIERFQIDETAFEQILEDEISYYNPRALEDDINSVRSIYVLRQRRSPSSLEKSRAILVTSNPKLARAAWNYGREYEESRDVSSVITDWSLANTAWLKAPMGAPSLPTNEVLAFSYAALQPSRELLDVYLREIEKLEENGDFQVQKHQILRSSPIAHDELMNLTLGDEAELTPETITQTLERVTERLKVEETERLIAESKAHNVTKSQLDRLQKEKKIIQEHIYWRCYRDAGLYAKASCAVIGCISIGGITGGILGFLLSPLVASLIGLAAGVLALMNLWFGITIKDIHERLRHWLLPKLLRREVALLGMDMNEYGDINEF